MNELHFGTPPSMRQREKIERESEIEGRGGGAFSEF